MTKNRPLAFLAQINLAEASQYDRTGLLPTSGVLSFFYETVSMEWGFEPEHKGYARVYYFPETEGLVPTQIPEETKEWSVGEQALSFADAVSLLCRLLHTAAAAATRWIGIPTTNCVRSSDTMLPHTRIIP